MKKFFRTISLVLAVFTLLALLPAFVIADENIPGHIIDDNPEGGYSGDYVVIYNGGTTSNGTLSTGSMAGLISSDIVRSANASRNSDSERSIIDVDSMLVAPDALDAQPIPATRARYSVGTTKSFAIHNYSPAGEAITFELAAIGAHCYVWTPVNESLYPLDIIDESYAQAAADEFDSKFGLMTASFGNFADFQGNGKVDLMFYNIDDNWEAGQGYVGGYFWSGDFYYNSSAMLHIDTYPGIMWTDTDGAGHKELSSCFGTMVHEFQHLINYSRTNGNMETWLNESLSAAAEELCYPGSCLFPRIQSWNDSYWKTASELENPPAEYVFNSSYDLHKGGSIYTWDSSASDIYARYAIVALLSQYIYSQSPAGNGAFSDIIASVANGASSTDALFSSIDLYGADFIKSFAAAMVCKCNDEYNGLYGFDMQADYNASAYYGIENLYALLGRVVFTGESTEINGGGFIVIKPEGGVYYPPEDAGSELGYIGITVPEDENIGSETLATPKPTNTPITSEGAVSDGFIKASTLEAGEQYLLCCESDGVSYVATTSYQNPTNSRYPRVAAVNVAVNGNVLDIAMEDTSYGTSVSDFLFTVGGNAAEGYTLSNESLGYLAFNTSGYPTYSGEGMIHWALSKNGSLRNSDYTYDGYSYLSYNSKGYLYYSNAAYNFTFYKMVEEGDSVPAASATAEPTVQPTAEPTTEPTEQPTAEPTAEPTTEPTAEPTAEPTTASEVVGYRLVDGFTDGSKYLIAYVHGGKTYVVSSEYYSSSNSRYPKMLEVKLSTLGEALGIELVSGNIEDCLLTAQASGQGFKLTNSLMGSLAFTTGGYPTYTENNLGVWSIADGAIKNLGYSYDRYCYLGYSSKGYLNYSSSPVSFVLYEKIGERSGAVAEPTAMPTAEATEAPILTDDSQEPRYILAEQPVDGKRYLIVYGNENDSYILSNSCLRPMSLRYPRFVSGSITAQGEGYYIDLNDSRYGELESFLFVAESADGAWRFRNADKGYLAFDRSGYPTFSANASAYSSWSYDGARLRNASWTRDSYSYLTLSPNQYLSYSRSGSTFSFYEICD